MAESQAVLTIFNLALGHVGNPAVTTASASPVCQLFYPFVRDKLLSWSPWTFATTRQRLAKLDDAPASDFLIQYRIPTDPFPLRLLDIDTRGLMYKREVYIDPLTPQTQTPVILTDADPVVLKYIARVSESVWHPLFVDTCALWLGLAITQRTSGKTALRAQIFAELQLQLARTQDVDGHQDSPNIAHLNESYIAVRLSDGIPRMADVEQALTDPF